MCNDLEKSFKHCQLAKEFEKLILDDGRFEITSKTVMGLVCFRLKKGNKLTELLLSEILEDGRIYMIPALCRDVYFLRLAVVAERTTSEDIRFSFEVIKTCADKVLRSSGDFKEDEPVFVDIDLSRKKPTQPSKIKTHK